MKVRIVNNIFRFRLKEEELALLAESGFVKETVEFGYAPEMHYSYCLQVVDEKMFRVDFQQGNIWFYIPAAYRSISLRGIQAEIDTGHGRKIKLLVEKDFACVGEYKDAVNL